MRHKEDKQNNIEKYRFWLHELKENIKITEQVQISKKKKNKCQSMEKNLQKL